MTLLPCPFCGGPGKIFENKGDNADYYGFVWGVCCDEKECAYFDGRTEKEAADRWNTRNGVLQVTNE